MFGGGLGFGGGWPAGTRADERGASAVEFAIVVPLLLMLVIGLFSGGLAYNRQLTLTHAAREGVRFAATLPTGKSGIPNSWFDDVAARARESSAGEINDGVPGRTVCVAYIGNGSGPAGSSQDWTRKRTQVGMAAPTYTAGVWNNPATWCYDDGRRAPDANERRIQVVIGRDTDFDVFVWSRTLALTSEAGARYEAWTAS